MAGKKGKGDDLPFLGNCKCGSLYRTQSHNEIPMSSTLRLRKDGIKSTNGPIFLPKPSNKKSRRPGYIPMRLIYIMHLMNQVFGIASV